MVAQQHYCTDHQSKFFKNERTDKLGQSKIWYSHKIKNGVGFCLEKVEQTKQDFLPTTLKELSAQRNDQKFPAAPYGAYACNAMNNAVALACNGKIELDQIGKYYSKILSEFMKTIQ